MRITKRRALSEDILRGCAIDVLDKQEHRFLYEANVTRARNAHTSRDRDAWCTDALAHLILTQESLSNSLTLLYLGVI